MLRLLLIRVEVELGQLESARLCLVMRSRLLLASPRLNCDVSRLSLHMLINVVLIHEYCILLQSLIVRDELKLLVRVLM